MSAVDYVYPQWFSEGMEVLVPVANLPAAMRAGKPLTSGLRCTVVCAIGDSARLDNGQTISKYDVRVHVSHEASGVDLARDTIEKAERAE